QLPVAREHDGRAVGREGVARPDVHLREAFLLVAVESGRDHLLRSRSEVAADEYGVVVAPRDEEQRPAVGRQGRPYRAPVAAREGQGLAGRAVVAHHLPEALREIGRVAEARLAGGEVEVPPGP